MSIGSHNKLQREATDTYAERNWPAHVPYNGVKPWYWTRKRHNETFLPVASPCRHSIMVKMQPCAWLPLTRTDLSSRSSQTPTGKREDKGRIWYDISWRYSRFGIGAFIVKACEGLYLVSILIIRAWHLLAKQEQYDRTRTRVNQDFVC